MNFGAGSQNAGSNFTQGGGGGGQSSNAGGSRRTHPIRPLTVKQLLEAQRVGEGVTVIDGREVTQATIAGRIIEYENPSANAAMTARHHGYKVSDGTGVLLVRQWMDPDQTEELLPLHSYVRASGTVKVWQDKPIVTGGVRLISDCNELTFHFLDALLTHLRITQGNRQPRDLSNKGASVTNSAQGVGIQNMLPGGDEKIYATDLLLNVIKQNAKGDQGLSMDDLAMAAQRYNFSMADVRIALRTLAAEGKVYQTHDNRFNV